MRRFRHVGVYLLPWPTVHLMSYFFSRAALAQDMRARLSDDPIFGAPQGLFLSAPRRTGKSTFLRRDLIPLLEEEGLCVVYVDLWANRQAEPAELLADGLIKMLRRHLPQGQKILEALPFSSVSVAGVKVDLATTSNGRSGSLTDVIMAIGDRAARDVVLIIDEAQDLYNSEAGRAALFALKAARDAMNQRADAPGLYLVFTGSNRDKLGNLVTKNDQAFYGATVTPFPPLDRAYINALVREINPRLADDNKLDTEDVLAAFALVDHRPELLLKVIQDHALGGATAPGLRKSVSERADGIKALRWQEHKITFDSLTDIQQAVLRLLAARQPSFSPYAEETLEEVTGMLGREVVKGDVQKAIGALRKANIIWHRARGLYAFEERDMADWILHQYEDET